MKIDTPITVPAECVALVEELVHNAVDFGRASIGRTCALELDEYSVLTLQRKFLYEYLAERVTREPADRVCALRFR